MSREIKFRAFSKIKKRMFPVYGLGQDWVTEDTLDGVDPGNNCFSGYDFLNNIVVMQFTGLKDRNGVEIFEGDIIETYQGEYVEVKFCNGAFVWYDGEPLGFGIHIGELGEDPFIVSETTEDWCEVKGNIHQHKESLNK